MAGSILARSSSRRRSEKCARSTVLVTLLFLWRSRSRASSASSQSIATVPFDYTLTIIGGVALLLASTVSGAFALLTPERLGSDP